MSFRNISNFFFILKLFKFFHSEIIEKIISEIILNLHISKFSNETFFQITNQKLFSSLVLAFTSPLFSRSHSEIKLIFIFDLHPKIYIQISLNRKLVPSLEFNFPNHNRNLIIIHISSLRKIQTFSIFVKNDQKTLEKLFLLNLPKAFCRQGENLKRKGRSVIVGCLRPAKETLPNAGVVLKRRSTSLKLGFQLGLEPDRL